eukprot:RCo023210
MLRLCVSESELVTDPEELQLTVELPLSLAVAESLLLLEKLAVEVTVGVAVALPEVDVVTLIEDFVGVLEIDTLRLSLPLRDFVPLIVNDAVPLGEQLAVRDLVLDVVTLSEPLPLREGERVPLEETVLDTLLLCVADTVVLRECVKDSVLVTLAVSELRLAESEGEGVPEQVNVLLAVQLELRETVPELDSELLPLHVLVCVCDQLADAEPDGEAVVLPL